MADPKALARQARYRAAHREELRAKGREYERVNRERIRAKRRARFALDQGERLKRQIYGQLLYLAMSPERKATYMEKRVQTRKRKVRELGTCYVREQLVARTGVPANQIPMAMVAAHAAVLKVKRALRAERTQ